MNRFLIAFGVLIVLVAVAILVVLLQSKPVSPNALAMPDGSALRVLAVTYGTNHVIGPPVARLVARMPPVMQPVLSQILGTRVAAVHRTTTMDPALMVWLERATNNTTPAPGYFDAILSDTNGFVSGETASISGWWSNPERLSFHAIPRRDRVVTVNFYYHTPAGKVSSCGSLPFANPLYGTYPLWKPESLPATRHAGDVEVILEKLSTGHGNNTTYKSLSGGRHAIDFGTNRDDGRNNTVCLLRLRSLTDSNQVWRIAGVEVSDATGNHVHNTSLGWGSYDQGYFTFAPALWPSEPAWKLRCELKRAEGFAPQETFLFENVPLGGVDATNSLGWSTNFNRVAITLNHIVRRAPNTNSSWSSSQLSQARFLVSGLTNDLHLDLIAARTDNGTNLSTGSWESGGDYQRYNFQSIPLEAKTADFQFAVQRSRWVEFTVKPEIGAARIEYKPAPRK